MSRSHFSVLATALLLSSGCVTSEQKTLATGGTPLGVGGDDTASPMGPMDDTGMSAGEGYRPVIDAVTATWNEGTDGWYIEASLTYTDEDDDVREGGMVGVTAVVEEETFATEWLAIDGVSAIHEEGEEGVNSVRFNPQPPDITDPSAISVELLIQLKDALTNRSDEVSVIPE